MTLDLNSYRRDCLLGALGALLMLAGDLCLSVIPAFNGDSDTPPGSDAHSALWAKTKL